MYWLSFDLRCESGTYVYVKLGEITNVTYSKGCSGFLTIVNVKWRRHDLSHVNLYEMNGEEYCQLFH